MKKILYILMLLPLLAIGQTATENYIKTTTFKKPLLGNYPNVSVSFNQNDLLINGNGGGSGNMTIYNNNLNVSFTVSFSSTTSKLKLGVVKTLNCVPAIQNLELGPILKNDNSETGFYAKISNNSLVFYSPYFPNVMSLTNTTGIAGGSTLTNYTLSIGNPYVCPPTPSGLGGGGSGTLTINRTATSGTIAINVSGGWSDLCQLRLSPAYFLVAIDPTLGIADTELGIVKTGTLNTVYKARIKSNKLEFYTDVAVPSVADYGKLNFNYNFTGTVSDKSELITYYDGIGRPIQEIAYGQSATGKDIVTPTVYDTYGRMEKDYLSFIPTTPSSLDIKTNEVLSFYATNNTALTGNPDFETTNNPYSQKDFEPAATERVMRQSAPGNDWAMNGGHEVKFDYQTNITQEVRKFRVVFPVGTTETHTLGAQGFYAASKLYKTVTKNEDWVAADGLNKTTQEFLDNEGRLLLKRAFNRELIPGSMPAAYNNLVYNTYYVYDDYGNLSYVIPPSASDAVDAALSSSAVANKNKAGKGEGELDQNVKSENKLTAAADVTKDIISEPTAISKVGPINPPNPPAAPTPVAQDIVDGLCYVYRYDYKNRIVERKVPGKGWEYIVYDKLDRVALTQDANLKLQNKWLFSKYDEVSRPAFSGQFTYTTTSGNVDSLLRQELQALITANTSLFENRALAPFQNGGVNVNYTNTLFPLSTSNFVSNYNVFIVNYYDDYNFKPYGSTLQIPTSSYRSNTNDILTNTKSLTTGSLIRVLDTNDWIVNLTAYDQMSRKVWTSTQNSYLHTSDVKEIQLNFIGNPMEVKSTHNKTGVTTNLITINKFTYDHSDRLIKQTQTIGGQEEMLFYNKYDELGNLMKKKVGGPAPAIGLTFDNVTTALQTIDYKINVRGWLKSINNPDAPLTDDLFAFKMNFNQPQLGAAALYNGNISETTWRTKNDDKVRSYKYAYDDLSRLTQADYVGNYGLVANPAQFENYSEGNLQYDKNGNITHLERYGLNTSTTIAKIDNLQFNYEPKSNKLNQVIDSGLTTGFKDVNDATNIDYGYDANGNMTKDLNKGLTNILYNHLNQPTKVMFNNNDPDISSKPKGIKYIYDATGAKVEKKFINTIFLGTWQPTTYEITEYANEYIYKDGLLEYLGQPEGYVAPISGGFSYVYQYKDQAGNVRLSYYKDPATSNLVIKEESNFTPFGVKHGGYNFAYNGGGSDVAQIRKHSGKELQEELGFNMYDFGARNYDPMIGRWSNVDALAETSVSNSPYAYALNNPVYFVDRDGYQPTPYEAALMAAHVYEGKGKLAGGWHPTKDTKYNLDTKDGLKATMYTRTKADGTHEFAYVFAGTVDGKDWINNLEQVIGASAQYSDAATQAKDISNLLGSRELTFVGHSLGGGLSNLSSIITGRTSMTFNPAWISRQTLKKMRARYGELTFKEHHQMLNFVHESDPLNKIQVEGGSSVGLEHIGDDYEIEGGIFSNVGTGHFIGTMTSRMESNGQNSSHAGNKNDNISKPDGGWNPVAWKNTALYQKYIAPYVNQPKPVTNSVYNNTGYGDVDGDDSGYDD